MSDNICDTSIEIAVLIISLILYAMVVSGWQQRYADRSQTSMKQKGWTFVWFDVENRDITSGRGYFIRKKERGR